MKRILSFIILLALMLPLIVQIAPIHANAVASNDEIRATVTKAYEDLLKSLNPGEGGASDGAMQLLNHAISGDGKDLIMDESDNFTAMLYNSKMFRDGMIDGLTAAFERLLKNYEQKMLAGGSYQYYEHKMNYSFSSYEQFGEMAGVDEESSGGAGSKRIETLKSVKDWPGTRNSYDDAMLLVAGTCSVRITIEKMEAAAGIARYRVSVLFWDNFDFGSGNYKGNDTDLAKALTWFGKIMAMGGAIKTYHLESHVNFDITFGNDCPHQTENFRWEWIGSDLAAVSGEGLSISNPSRIQTVVASTGKMQNPYFKLDKTVHLYHDRPWALEFRWSGYKISFSPGTTWSNKQPYLLRSTTRVVGSQSFSYKEFDAEKNKEVTRNGEDYYTAADNMDKLGYKRTVMHTYRLENRISGGSNMVYLIVDGEEIGPMNMYYRYDKSKTVNMNQTVDWFNGTDFKINYIYNSNYRMHPNDKLEYVQIWENGEGKGAYPYYYTENVASTCSGKGYTAHICSRCGDTWKDNFVDAKSHQYGAFTPSDDIMHVQSCTVCGEKQAEAHTWGAPQVNGMQIAYQCTVCKHVKVETLDKAGIQGKWTTELVLRAADLGVSAPDAVLRCTFDFQKDGSVSTSWAAGDLTALRLYFRDMFVSAYYAMAYGSGITDLQQVEETCIASTGMGVTAYMDSIVTVEAITAAFTPAADSGMYMVNEHGNAVYLGLNFMGISSDLGTPNAYAVEDDTMHLNAASFGKPEYTFVCKRVN